MPVTSRRVAVSAAWAVPAVALSTAAPASAASKPSSKPVCDPNKLSRPRPYLVDEPKGKQPRVTTVPGNRPADCPEVPTGRSSEACQNWRKAVDRRKSEEAAKAAWDAQSSKYQAYKAEDDKWRKENPGCSKIVKPQKAPVQPKPTPKPTAQPTQPTDPVVCTPWNKWLVTYHEKASWQGLGKGWRNHVRYYPKVSPNKRPSGGNYCATPTNNDWHWFTIQTVRVSGSPTELRSASMEHYTGAGNKYVIVQRQLGPNWPTPTPPVEKGGVVNRWRVGINAAEIVNWIDEDVYLKVQFTGTQGRVTNSIEIEGQRLYAQKGYWEF